MKKAQIIISLVTLLCTLLTFVSCGSAKENMGDAFDGINGVLDGNGAAGGPDDYLGQIAIPNYGEVPEQFEEFESPNGTEAESYISENPFVSTELESISTLSADVDTASYTLLRKLINSGYSLSELQNLAKSWIIRTEEMVNYFTYNYADAPEGEMFGTRATISKTPWNEETYLLTLGIKAKEIETSSPNNLVFLIDVSGSMSSEDKLPLLQTAFSYLVSQLNENDTVSIVTYAGDERVVLDGCAGNKKETILDAINHLTSGGSTNGEAGIRRAYEIAEAHFKPNGNNRIILASDGDLNVGISSPEELERLVSSKKDSGIFLSVLGFGSGNFRDANMSAIAQNGNGVYHYIDCAKEAERIFATSLLSTIYTVAKDAKFQLTFDPDYVSEYRLIGYENRLLAQEDFEDDTKDAGDVGSGHTLTVCYELKLTENAISGGTGDQDTALENWIKLAMRYKEPDEAVSRESELMIGEAELADAPDSEIRFIAAIIETCMLIRNSQYGNKATTLNSIISTLESLELTAEQEELCQLLKALSSEK